MQCRKDPLGRKLCGSKVIYKKLKKAQSDAAKFSLGYYKCDRCGKWHLTSQGLTETKYGSKQDG